MARKREMAFDGGPLPSACPNIGIAPGSSQDISERAASILVRYERHLFLGIAFLLPLKLSISYAMLLPAMLLWFTANFRQMGERLRHDGPLAIPLLLFVSVALGVGMLGIDPLHSLVSLASLTFFVFVIVLFGAMARRHGHIACILALICGQSIAALHSLVQAAFPEAIRDVFIGKVTESGQLSLTIPLALGLALAFEYETRATRPGFDLAWWRGGAVTVALIAIGFSEQLNIAGIWLLALCVICAGMVLLTLQTARTATPRIEQGRILLLGIALPLLTCALLVNLKRGPWAGVIVGALVLLVCTRKRLAIPIVAGVVLSAILVGPVQHRLSQSIDHFFIAGGRSEIWDIGIELGTRYPLGIGFSNSPILRDFSSDVPSSLTHFHSNFLNILVESGWLALGVFTWWLTRMLTTAFRRNPAEQPSFSILRTTIGCALLSWQVAGSVEYNFGDSEVVLVAFVLCGLLGTLSRPSPVYPPPMELPGKGSMPY